jgi:hypothetical protein
MATETKQYAVERPVDAGREVEHGEHDRSTSSSWTPAQFVGLTVGIALTVIGLVALSRTGFGVLLLAALIAPVFTTRTRHHAVRDEQHVLA